MTNFRTVTSSCSRAQSPRAEAFSCAPSGTGARNPGAGSLSPRCRGPAPGARMRSSASREMREQLIWTKTGRSSRISACYPDLGGKEVPLAQIQFLGRLPHDRFGSSVRRRRIHERTAALREEPENLAERALFRVRRSRIEHGVRSESYRGDLLSGPGNGLQDEPVSGARALFPFPVMVLVHAKRDIKAGIAVSMFRMRSPRLTAVKPYALRMSSS